MRCAASSSTPTTEGVREITFTVTDARGAESDPAVVRVNLTTAGAEAGDRGDDILIGEPDVNDAIAGRRGDDQLFGLSGNDVLDGGLDNDLLDGGAGNDVLIGGPGQDTLIGGPGADRHLFFTLTERGDDDPGLRRRRGRHARLQPASSRVAPTRTRSTRSCASTAPATTSWSASTRTAAATPSASSCMATLTDPTGVTTAQAAVDNGTLVVA